VFVFALGYLYRSRAELRFPRSLVLLPLAVALAWAANVVRIASLVAVGAWVSPEVAYGGFHSKAGWILFCVLALALVWLTHRSRYFSRAEPLPAGESTNPTAAYLLPMLVVIAVSLLTGLAASGVDLAYPLRVAAAVLVLLCFRRYYANLVRAPGWASVLIGVFVFLLWVAFVPTPDPERAGALYRGVAVLTPTFKVLWIGARLIGGIVTIPVVEELAFRGFLQRRFVSEDFTSVRFEERNPMGVIVSALVFGVLHSSSIAGTLAGLAYSFACYRRGRLADGILAHATTNALIAVWVLGFGRWDLWL
jgi:exosortase E/protease (VPEID-CTERM system)